LEQLSKERNTDLFQGFKVPSHEDDYSERTHPVFLTFWCAVNSLLILSILLAVYAAGWEYSTRRYLKGFSDAIIPESASPQEKIDAILSWMSHGPSRQQTTPDSSSSDRDPTSTLNYASLLRVCGSATNAFVNLADSEGLQARRLLLLDSGRRTRHVVAEVLMDERWIVVDPAFRTQLRGDNGQSLTREQLTDPAVLSSATAAIPKYSSDYTYDVTAHVRLSRIRFGGMPLRTMLTQLFPDWENSAVISLLLERESLATLAVALMLVSVLAFLRVAMRWYGESRLGFQSIRIRNQLRRASEAFFELSP
jgi:Transglutaminase-like superfamily